MKHTPKPWEIYVSALTRSKVIRNEKGSICSLTKPMHFTGQDERYKAEMEEYEANAKLIPAAPDLLEACETFKDMFIREWGEDLWITNHRDIEAAIKKATE